MKKSEIYAKAVDVINELGWTQGNYEDPVTGSVCTVGALRHAAWGGANWELGAPGRFLGALFGVGHPDGAVDIPSWNDDPSRTKEDVLLYLKEQAYEYEQRGE